MGFLQQGDLRMLALFRQWLASKTQKVEAARPAPGSAAAWLPCASLVRAVLDLPRAKEVEADCPSQCGAGGVGKGGKAELQETSEVLYALLSTV